MAAAARTVSVWVPAMRPVAAAVRVGVLARVSMGVAKLAVLEPEGMFTDVMMVGHIVTLSGNIPVMALVEDRLTVSAVVVTLPNGSSSWTVRVPEGTPAVRVTGVVV